MMTTARLLAFGLLLALLGGPVAPAVGQPEGEVTRVDGETLYVQLGDSINVDPGTVGRVVEERVVEGERVDLTFAVLAVNRVERPVQGPWIAVCQITRQSRNLEAGDPVDFDTATARPQLIVRSTPPDATVSVNGEEVGQTPLRGSINRGRHELRLSREGYRPETHTFSVEAGETQRIQDTLQTAIGTLAVRSLPDSATVEVGDRTLGETPLSTELQEGTYRLRVRQGGYLPYDDTVTVNAGTERQVNVPLRRPLRASLAEQHDSEVTNVALTREGDRLVVTYDLVGDADTYTVELLLSTNGGQTYEPLPETLAGAVGDGVTPDSDKQLVWAVTEDFPKGLTGSGNRLRLSVEASSGNGLYWVMGSVLTAGAGAAAATLLGLFGDGGGGGGGDLPDAPPPAPN